MTPTTISALLDRYDGLLLDAYGVLVDGGGALPHTAALFRELARRQTPYAIVTNDASRGATTYVKRFAGYGIAIEPHRFVTSGSLLPGYFRKLDAPRTLVLGTADSIDFVREGGGVPVALAPGMEIDAVAICDDDGTPFVLGLEIAIGAILRAVAAGRKPTLVLPNPDITFPKGNGEVGLTAGAMALLVEAALAHKGVPLVFDRLGKPAPHLFLEAATRLGIAPARLVMVGDTLDTDIAGAHAAGMHSALIGRAHGTLAPTYTLATIEL